MFFCLSRLIPSTVKATCWDRVSHSTFCLGLARGWMGWPKTRELDRPQPWWFTASKENTRGCSLKNGENLTSTGTVSNWLQLQSLFQGVMQCHWHSEIYLAATFRHSTHHKRWTKKRRYCTDLLRVPLAHDQQSRLQVIPNFIINTKYLQQLPSRNNPAWVEYHVPISSSSLKELAVSRLSSGLQRNDSTLGLRRNTTRPTPFMASHHVLGTWLPAVMIQVFAAELL